MEKGDVDLHQITTKPISQQKPNPTLKKPIINQSYEKHRLPNPIDHLNRITIEAKILNPGFFRGFLFPQGVWRDQGKERGI